MQTKTSTQERLDDLLRDFADLRNAVCGVSLQPRFRLYTALLPFLELQSQ